LARISDTKRVQLRRTNRNTVRPVTTTASIPLTTKAAIKAQTHINHDMFILASS